MSSDKKIGISAGKSSEDLRNKPSNIKDTTNLESSNITNNKAFINDETDIINIAMLSDPSLLIVDDDKVFLNRLARSMTNKGFNVTTSETFQDAIEIIGKSPPAFAIFDMRLNDGNGLDLVDKLSEKRENAKTIILTGYGNLTTAVSAIKLGANNYLAKPADAEEIFQALISAHEIKPDPPQNPMSADRVKWEHIQNVYELCDRNISETARRLNMHRRTLQRILTKHAPQ